jgi:hypothetical protein
MAKLLGVIGETFGETLGVSWLGPIILGGVVVAVVSPEARSRLRRWGVQGIAAAMAAREVAANRMKSAGNGTSGMATQFGQRILQAASELREEWEDFLAEAHTVKDRIAPSSDNNRRQGQDVSPGRPRRRASKPRARRPPAQT